MKADICLLKWMAGTGMGLTLLLLGAVLTVLVRLGEVQGQIAQLGQRIQH